MRDAPPPRIHRLEITMLLVALGALACVVLAAIAVVLHDPAPSGATGVETANRIAPLPDQSALR